jgi:hypothetical protein
LPKRIRLQKVDDYEVEGVDVGDNEESTSHLTKYTYTSVTVSFNEVYLQEILETETWNIFCNMSIW